MQPSIWPTFLCRPERVRGMPIALEIFRLAAVIPSRRFQEKPNLFMAYCVCVRFTLS